MVAGSPFMRMVRPTTSAPPNRRRHRPSPIITVRGAAGSASAATKSRPASGRAPVIVSTCGCRTMPRSSSGSPAPSARFATVGEKTPAVSIDVERSDHAKKLPGLMTLRARPRVRLCSHTITRRSASGYGSGARSAACTTANAAVVAPMPSASTITTAAVKPGARASSRAACRISRPSPASQGPDAGSGAGGSGAGWRRDVSAARSARRSTSSANWSRSPSAPPRASHRSSRWPASSSTTPGGRVIPWRPRCRITRVCHSCMTTPQAKRRPVSRPSATTNCVHSSRWRPSTWLPVAVSR